MWSPEPVPEVVYSDEITPEWFDRECVRTSKPIVLRGLADAWPARKWQFPRLERDWPLPALQAHAYVGGRGQTLKKEILTAGELSRQLSEADEEQGSKMPYWAIYSLKDALELLEGFPVPSLCPRGLDDHIVLAGRNTQITSHYHPLRHALLCQVHGKKRVLLHPPRDASNLYPNPLWGAPNFFVSQIDSLVPDLERFPKLSATHPMETVLGPGDAVFIPVSWWHACYGTGPVLAVTMMWFARFREHPFPHPGIRNMIGSGYWTLRERLNRFVPVPACE